MGNKLIGIAFIFIGIVFLIFGAVTAYIGITIGTLFASFAGFIPEGMSGLSFISMLPTTFLALGILEIITAVLSFIAGISLIRYKEE